MYLIQVSIWLLAGAIGLFQYQTPYFDKEFMEELFWLAVSLSVIVYCYKHYQDKLLLIGFIVYILGQLFDVLDSYPLLAENILIRFDTGLKNLGFAIICIALFQRVKEKRALIEQLTAEITHKTNLQKKLEYAAYHDELTELLNRKALFERIEAKSNELITLLYMDLDNFKQANDMLGHAEGDRILQNFALELIATFGHENAFRLGGDEFVVISQRSYNPSEQEALANQLSHVLVEYGVGVSIGQHQRSEAESPDEAMHQADLAMYTAKKSKSTFRSNSRSNTTT